MSTVTKPAEQLLEAWGDVVATTDSGWLQDHDSGYGTTLARYQRPATTLFDRTDGRFLPIYQTEFDLAVIRAMGRTLAQVSPALVVRCERCATTRLEKDLPSRQIEMIPPTCLPPIRSR